MTAKKKKPRRRGCPPGGTKEGLALLIRLWELSDMMCGKLLHAVMGCYLESLRKRKAIPEAVCEEVLKMSAATIDRRLRSIKTASGPRRRRRCSSLDEHRREIPLKVDVWPSAYPKTPGYIEVDTVAHCGGNMAGSFVWTLTMTDVATAWTRVVSVWNKGAVGVCDAIDAFLADAPFEVLMLNSDNGGEFINNHIKRHFAQFLPSVVRTRSRSYKKNDNAHVEQKNAVQVRSLYGHERIDDVNLLTLMNRINTIQEAIKNLYTPTMRLLSKERNGSKYVKRYEKRAKTPAQRILESPEVSENDKAKVRALLVQHDFVTLRDNINADLKRLARKQATAPAGATSESLPNRPSVGSGPRPPSSNTRGKAAALPLKPPPALVSTY